MTATLRIGTGLDVHAFADQPRPLVLGGVEIPGAPGLAGHSDADVVAHAVIDALLGALALGDLGSRFGLDTPQLADVDSMGLLRTVTADLRAAEWQLGNLDAVIVAQRPRIGAHRDRIRQALTDALGGGPGAVSVKATTTDRLGAIGRGEGIACWATVTVVRA